jgi:hypothetical protein
MQLMEKLDTPAESLQQMECDLKASVEEEVASECGRLALQGPGGSKVQWTSVALGSTHTPAEVVQEGGRRAAGVTGIVKTRFECLPLSSRSPLKRQDITSLLDLIWGEGGGALSASDAVVVSSEKGAVVCTMVAVAASMAQRMRASNGQRPSDLISREPLPLTRKWNAPRGLLEEFGPVDAFIKALDEIYPINDGTEKLGEISKLICDDTVDRWAVPIHLRKRVMELDRAAKIAGETSDAPGPLGKTANIALKQYLVMIAFAALLHAPLIEEPKLGVKSVKEHQTAVLDALDVVSNLLITE